MRHRNDTDQPLVVATEPPQTVEPGEEVDAPDHVAGMTCLDDPCPPETAAPTEPASVDQPAEPITTEPAPRSGRRRTTDTAEEA